MTNEGAEEGKDTLSVTQVEDQGRIAPSEAAPFTTDDMRKDLKAKLRRRPKSMRPPAETDLSDPDAQTPLAQSHPLKVVYAILGGSALLTGSVAILLLRLIGGPQLSPITLWFAPLVGAGLFLVLGVLLARSSMVMPR